MDLYSYLYLACLIEIIEQIGSETGGISEAKEKKKPSLFMYDTTSKLLSTSNCSNKYLGDPTGDSVL